MGFARTRAIERGPIKPLIARARGVLGLAECAGPEALVCERKGTKANRLLGKTGSANKKNCSMASLARTRTSDIANWLPVARAYERPGHIFL